MSEQTQRIVRPKNLHADLCLLHRLVALVVHFMISFMTVQHTADPGEYKYDVHAAEFPTRYITSSDRTSTNLTKLCLSASPSKSLAIHLITHL